MDFPDPVLPTIPIFSCAFCVPTVRPHHTTVKFICTHNLHVQVFQHEIEFWTVTSRVLAMHFVNTSPKQEQSNAKRTGTRLLLAQANFQERSQALPKAPQAAARCNAEYAPH